MFFGHDGATQAKVRAAAVSVADAGRSSVCDVRAWLHHLCGEYGEYKKCQLYALRGRVCPSLGLRRKREARPFGPIAAIRIDTYSYSYVAPAASVRPRGRRTPTNRS